MGIFDKIFRSRNGEKLSVANDEKSESRTTLSKNLLEQIKLSGGVRFRQVEGNPETMYAVVEDAGTIVIVKRSHIGFSRNALTGVKAGVQTTDEEVVTLHALAIMELVLEKERAAELHVVKVMQAASAKEYLTEVPADWDVPCWLVMLKNKKIQQTMKSEDDSFEKLSHDQQLALFLPPVMLRGLAFSAAGVMFNGVFVKIDEKIANWALPYSERITSASRSFREGQVSEAFQEFFDLAKIMPDAAVVLMNMGICMAATGDKEKAKKFLQWSLRYIPEEFKHLVTNNLSQL
jgi:hypothetical protein